MGDQGQRRIATSQGVLGVVQVPAVEPPTRLDAVSGEDLLMAALAGDLEELPDRHPELLEILDRPLPELAVIGERKPPPAGQPSCKPSKLGDSPARRSVTTKVLESMAAYLE